MINVLLGILAFIVFCILWTKYAKPKIETFTSGKTPIDNLVNIKSTNSELADMLNKLKYRVSYEDTILELETWATNSQLSLVAKGVIGIDTLANSIEAVRQFNDLKVFKSNLNELINVLDTT
jgi:hypothetical protein